MFCKLCGEIALKNVVIVTNAREGGSQAFSEARERELFTKFFKPALDGGARVVQHRNTLESAHNIIRKITGGHPVALQIQRELVDKRKDIVDTTAGKVINRELNELMRRHHAELVEVLEEMERASKKGDEETKQELGEKKRRLQERVGEIAKEEKGMSAGYVAEKARVEARIKEAGQGVQKRERDTHSLLDESKWTSISESQPTPTPLTPVRIACVHKIPLLLRSHFNLCNRVIGATGSGKTTVSRIIPVNSQKLIQQPPVYQSRKWFESTNRDGLGVVHGRGPTREQIHSRWKTGGPDRHPGIR